MTYTAIFYWLKNTNFDKICDIQSCRCDGVIVGDSQDDSYHIHITKRLQTDWKMYPKILYLSNFSYIFDDACLYVGKSGRCNFMRSLSGIGIVGVTGVRLGNVWRWLAWVRHIILGVTSNNLHMNGWLTHRAPSEVRYQGCISWNRHK